MTSVRDKKRESVTLEEEEQPEVRHLKRRRREDTRTADSPPKTDSWKLGWAGSAAVSGSPVYFQFY